MPAAYPADFQRQTMNETDRSGECEREGKAVHDGLSAVESWLVRLVGPAHDALNAGPSRAVTAVALRARLAAEYAKDR